MFRVGGSGMTELKPCPFCGSEAVSDWRSSRAKPCITLYQIGCTNSDCIIQPETFWMATEEKAIEAWNRRKK